MIDATPHYLLFSETTAAEQGAGRHQTGRWRFVLEAVDDGPRVAAHDAEPGNDADRLELLAVVRGLEALDGPARVTLITRSRYVSRGIRHGLNEWRRRNWRWERFGRSVPVRDHDLWRRVDRALEFHRVDCRVWGGCLGDAQQETGGQDTLRQTTFRASERRIGCVTRESNPLTRTSTRATRCPSGRLRPVRLSNRAACSTSHSEAVKSRRQWPGWQQWLRRLVGEGMRQTLGAGLATT